MLSSDFFRIPVYTLFLHVSVSYPIIIIIRPNTSINPNLLEKYRIIICSCNHDGILLNYNNQSAGT